MDKEFVDFYQILELPLDADRDTLRRRINDLYLDAQSNLEHRNRATRLKFQKLFESTLPQARFILLDETRRPQYTRLVRDLRAHAEGHAEVHESFTPPPPPKSEASSPEISPNSAALSAALPAESIERVLRPQNNAPLPEDLSYNGRSAQIEPLPTSLPAPEHLEQQRDELWKKWKVGLEEALAQEKSALGGRESAKEPRKFYDAFAATEIEAIAPQPLSPQARETQERQERARQGQSQSQTNPPAIEAGSRHWRAAQNSVAAPVEAAPLSPSEALDFEAQHIEARRMQHRRDATREVLENVGFFWSCVGAISVAVPGAAALIAFMGHNYPRGARPLLHFDPNLLWISGFLIIVALDLVVARLLSKAMRHRRAIQLAALSYEELLRKSGKT